MASDYDIGVTDYTLQQNQLEKIEQILKDGLVGINLNNAMLIDMAGNIIAKCDNGKCEHDIYSLAALASANFAAVDTMAKIIGEEEFSLLFHKGEHESIHFSRVADDFLLITLFGKEVSLGLLRLKIAETIEKIKSVWH